MFRLGASHLEDSKYAKVVFGLKVDPRNRSRDSGGGPESTPSKRLPAMFGFRPTKTFIVSLREIVSVMVDRLV